MSLQINYNNQLYNLTPEFCDLKASELSSILEFTEQQLMFYQLQSIHTPDGSLEYKFKQDTNSDEAFIEVKDIDLDKVYEVKISDLRDIHVDRLNEDERQRIKEDFLSLVRQVKGEEYVHSMDLEDMSVALEDVRTFYEQKCAEKCEKLHEKCEEMIQKNADKRDKYLERCSKKIDLTKKKYQRQIDSFRNSDVDKNLFVEWREFLASEALSMMSQRRVFQRRRSSRDVRRTWSQSTLGSSGNR
mmetsp:Transcript_5814/g.22070  ORF Transcript_5814/g.22070 Transcript_5814/m.22070 type:complete len:244 (+) Transcript_5814:545-1276(+)